MEYILVGLPEYELVHLEGWLNSVNNCPFFRCSNCLKVLPTMSWRDSEILGCQICDESPCDEFGCSALVDLALELLEYNNYELRSDNPKDYPRLEAV